MGLPGEGLDCYSLRRVLPGPRAISKRTVGGTLRSGLLAATAADADAVDNVALLGLVSEAAGLVGARGARGAVADVQLTELY